MNKFERPNKVQYDRRQQSIPDARGYLPGKDAETVFGLSRRDAQDVCCEMRPYNLNKHGRAQDESEVASVCSEFKNAPPVQPPTRRSFLQIQQGSDMKYSTNYGPFADQNKVHISIFNSFDVMAFVNHHLDSMLFHCRKHNSFDTHLRSKSISQIFLKIVEPSLVNIPKCSRSYHPSRSPSKFC